MEGEGILKRASFVKGNHCLSDKGRKKAIMLKRDLKFVDYYSIISKFPEIELRDRIENLEKFLITSLILLVIYIFAQTKIPPLILQNFFLLIIFLAIFLAFTIFILSYFMVYLIKIVFLCTAGLERDILWKYKEWLWNNRNKFIYPIPAIIVISLLYFIYTMNILDWRAIAGGIALFVIGEILINYKKISAKISKILEKHFKSSKK